MSCKNKCLRWLCLVPKSEQSYLKPGVQCAKFPNFIFNLFKESWVIRLLSDVDIVKHFFNCFRIKSCNELFRFF